MKIYLAAAYGRRAELEEYAKLIQSYGHEITSSWVSGAEENLGRTREQSALMDIEDVDRCDMVLSFTHPRGTKTSGGGRHVEFGYGYAKNKILVLIGEQENVFHHLPGVQVLPDLDTWIALYASPIN
jgi:nucleoside 2-deoxyribosyltransferase